MLIILGFLFHQHKKNLQLLIFSVLVLFVILVTQSTGGILGFIIISTIFLVKGVLKTSVSHSLIILLCFTTFLSVIITLIISFKEDNLFFSLVYDKLYDRMFEADSRLESGGGRFNIWLTLFNLFPLPIGMGYNLYVEEISGIRSPHSDLFGMIYRYGFFSLIPIFYFFYKKFKETYLIIIPALITFFINSLFDSQKLLLLFFLFVVFVSKTTKNSRQVKLLNLHA